MIGHIPIEFGFLKELNVLHLGKNNLTGFIPTSLGNCSSLRYLWLNDNHLIGTIPDEFENFGLWKNLVYFSVSNNNLKGRIPSFSDSIDSNLVFLDFSINNFGGTLPTHINGSHLSNLCILMLSYNQLEGPIPSWFGDLKGLQILDLSHNKLIGSIPQNFENLNGYKVPYDKSTTLGFIGSTLNLTSSSISYTQTFLSYFNLILTIKSQNMPEQYKFIQLGATTYMDLSSNELEGEIPIGIANLIGMKYLIVSNNKLKGQIPLAFQNLTELETLDLSQNNLIGSIPLTLPSTLITLSTFNVSFNNLSGAIPTGNQFTTFGVTSYLPGNPGLCGDVINMSCMISNNETLSIHSFGDKFHNSNHISIQAFEIGAICGILIVAIITIIWNPTFIFVFEGEIRRRVDIKQLETTNVQEQYNGLFQYPT